MRFDVGSTLIKIQWQSEKTVWKADFDLKNSQRVRFWVKIFTTRQILELKNYNASGFETENLQRVRFWFQNFTTRQILKRKNFSKSMIWRKNIFRKQVFKKTLHTKKLRFHSFHPVKSASFAVYVQFWKGRLWRKNQKRKFEEFF